MNLLLTGSSGQLGHELQGFLGRVGDVHAVDRNRLDLTDIPRVRAMVRELKPQLIINAAGYTAVDRAESERELAMLINGVVPGVLAEEALRLGGSIIHYSTDYVFDGRRDRPYRPDDAPNPLSFYGHSKLAGEEAVRRANPSHLIFRLSWLYGLRGQNFLQRIVEKAKAQDELAVVDDQWGSPTWAWLAAKWTAAIIEQIWPPAPRHRLNGSRGLGSTAGTYHLNCSGATTWCRFAKRIVELLDDEIWGSAGPPRVRPIPTSDYPTPARRPAWSVLDVEQTEKAFGLTMTPWEAALKAALAQPRQRNGEESGEVVAVGTGKAVVHERQG